MVTSDCSGDPRPTPDTAARALSRNLVTFEELEGPLMLIGLRTDWCMLQDLEGRRTILGLDYFADDYTDCTGEFLNRLEPSDAFRVGMEWAWQRQNRNLRQVIELAARDGVPS